jgi:hypothetical protein
VPKRVSNVSSASCYSIVQLDGMAAPEVMVASSANVATIIDAMMRTEDGENVIGIRGRGDCWPLMLQDISTPPSLI